MANKVITEGQLQELLAAEEQDVAKLTLEFQKALSTESPVEWGGVKIKLVRANSRKELLKELLCFEETPF